MNFSRSLTILAALTALGSAQGAWTRLPYAEARQVDIAAKSIPGTKLVSSAGLGNAAALLGSDVNAAITLAAGKSSAVILLGSQQNIHTVAFNNDAADGKITMAGSADNKSWSNLGSAEFARGDRVAQLHFPTTTVKYIRVTFESEKGGSIRSFAVLGDSTDRDYTLVSKDAGEGGSTVNLASATGGARPIYAFPTPINVGELNHLQNVFKFPKSRDKYRTIVYDLGAPRTVKHFATSYSQRPVRIEVFAFEQLPEKKDWRGKLTLDPAIFSELKPVAVGEDPRGVGHIKITPNKAVSARYIALRFEPNYQRAAAVGSFNVGTLDSVASAAGPVEAVSDPFGVLPGFHFTAGEAGDGGEFIIGSVEFASSGLVPANARWRCRRRGRGTGGWPRREPAAVTAMPRRTATTTVPFTAPPISRVHQVPSRQRSRKALRIKATTGTTGTIIITTGRARAKARARETTPTRLRRRRSLPASFNLTPRRLEQGLGMPLELAGIGDRG